MTVIETSCARWKAIDTAPNDGGRKMFVVIAFGVQMTANSHPYNTDPYCVWRNRDGTFARWPHKFQPTHYMLLPDPPK